MNADPRRYDLPGVADAYAGERFGSARGRRRDRREARQVAALFARLADRAGTVIDVPCGAGRFADRLPSRAVLSGDLSWSMLQHTRRRDATLPLVQCSAAALPLRTGSVDTAFCLRLLHHLDGETRLAVLRELGRVARRHAIVSIFLGPSLQGVRRSIRRLLGRSGSRRSITRWRFARDLSASGWTVRARLPRARFVSEQWLFLLERGGATAGP